MSQFNGAGFRALLAAVLFGLATLGCAIIPKPTQSARVGQADALGECADFFSSLDRRTSKAHVIDPGAFRVERYPYLRVNRFLESFRTDADDEAEFSAWVNRMQALDRQARRLEIDNLPRNEGMKSPDGDETTALKGRVDTCGNLLKGKDFSDTSRKEELRKTISVPSDYRLAARIFGVYPVSSVFVSHGVTKWHAEARATFSNTPPSGWRAVTYAPQVADRVPETEQIVSGSKRDALGIPDYSASDQDALFNAYAPVWQIRTEGPYDRIGAPFWSGGELSVDIEQPVVYTLLSFTRFGPQVLTQLNYIIWFPARPKESWLDIYGGFLDGVNYRVTLDPKGKPLVYETMHNCGCYYEAYPTQRLKVRDHIDYAEPPLILSAPDPGEDDVMTLALESRTHYVQHFYTSSRRARPETVPYTFKPYDELRSLPGAKNGHKSMFAEDSIAYGSERLERFILWTTGVFSPGAMRQWGRHPVAFVGERHFDDPHALEKMFAVSASD